MASRQQVSSVSVNGKALIKTYCHVCRQLYHVKVFP